MFKSIEEFQTFGKDQLDAATEAASKVSKSVQAISTEATDFGPNLLCTFAV